ncbi:hypothetical protein VB779_00420 [Haloarculaceae archaeon H-GB11]|nr:hypothetical protein [Haloarculaceae archaeon H-GB11]
MTDLISERLDDVAFAEKTRIALTTVAGLALSGISAAAGVTKVLQGFDVL